MVPLTSNPNLVNAQDSSLQIQAAVKNMATNAVFYFAFTADVETLFTSSPSPDVSTFANQWKSSDESQEASIVIKGKSREASREPNNALFDVHFSLSSSHVDLPSLDLSVVQSKLALRDITFVVNRDLPEGQRASYFYARSINNTNFLVELKFKAGMNVCKVSVRSTSKPVADVCKVTVATILLAAR